MLPQIFSVTGSSAGLNDRADQTSYRISSTTMLQNHSHLKPETLAQRNARKRQEWLAESHNINGIIGQMNNSPIRKFEQIALCKTEIQPNLLRYSRENPLQRQASQLQMLEPQVVQPPVQHQQRNVYSPLPVIAFALNDQQNLLAQQNPVFLTPNTTKVEPAISVQEVPIAFQAVEKTEREMQELRRRQLADELMVQIKQSTARKQNEKKQKELEDLETEKRIHKERQELYQREMAEQERLQRKKKAQEDRYRILLAEQEKMANLMSKQPQVKRYAAEFRSDEPKQLKLLPSVSCRSDHPQVEVERLNSEIQKTIMGELKQQNSKKHQSAAQVDIRSNLDQFMKEMKLLLSSEFTKLHSMLKPRQDDQILSEIRELRLITERKPKLVPQSDSPVTKVSTSPSDRREATPAPLKQKERIRVNINPEVRRSLQVIPKRSTFGEPLTKTKFRYAETDPINDTLLWMLSREREAIDL